MAELTVCFETNFEEAAQRKGAKYRDLVEQAIHNSYSATLLTIQMGSRGVPHYPSFQRLATATGMTRQRLSHLLENATVAALTGSFLIRCSRNCQTTTSVKHVFCKCVHVFYFILFLCMCVVIPSDCVVIFVHQNDKLTLDMITPALY